MSQSGGQARVVAGCFALGAFAVAIVAGLAAQNPAQWILLRALVAMAVCYAVGGVLGMIAERVIAEHLDTYRSTRPVPAVPAGTGASRGDAPNGAASEAVEDRGGGS